MEDQRKEHFQQKEVQVQEAETNLTAPRIAGKPMKSPHSEARYSEARWEEREGGEDQVRETGRSQIR